VAVLSALHGEEALAAGGLGVLRIAELVGSDKSQVSRTLKILAEYGLVDRDPHTRAYRLGWQLFALASRAGDTHLLAAAGPVVKELGRTLGERSHLSVLQGTEVLTLLSESPEHAVQAAGWVGRLVPAFGSIGSIGVVYVGDIVLGLPLAAAFRVGLRPPDRAAWGPVVAAGLFETAGFACITVGSRLAPLALVSPLASLASALTVLYAWTFLRERPARAVLVGAALVCAGVVVLAL